MLARSVLVTGSNRGLGLELVKQLSASKDPPEFIIATCRTPDKAEELKNISTEHRNVHITQLDVSNESSYGGLVSHVQELVGCQGLNLLINNAGYSPKSTRINMVKWQQMSDTLLINTIAPVMLTKALLPLLSTAASDSALDTLSVKRAAIINMSSILGSIGANEQGGLYPYRASKAALNAVTKSLSLDLRRHNILVTSIHPGWVQTDMGGKNAPLTPEVSISEMIKTLYALSEKHNGGFFQYDGEALQW
ncbi:C-signal-like [Macrobrachium rosenbergii]|uniref:C-signal-like n=1 Tax=Macrobrachium rosenbergii TaxID=79674 RepID=UPI0034D57779